MTNPVRQNAYLVANGTGTIFPTVVFDRAPASSDFNYPITQRWIDTSDSNAEWFLLKFTSSNGVVTPDWVQLASGALTTESLTGNTGGAVGPDGTLTINVIGDSSGIQFAGTPGTSTLTATLANIPNSSLAHSSITLVAGTGISITTSPVSLGGSTTISTTASLSAFNQVVITQFLTSGTYTPTAGMKYCIIELVGAGGGGGGSANTASGTNSSGNGGGAGGYARQAFAAATIGVSQTVTIGAGGAAGSNSGGNGGNGGTTSVGVLISATGGTGGTSNGVGDHSEGVGGVGGVGTGTLSLTGMAGGAGYSYNIATVVNFAQGGYGGSTVFGAGGLTSIDSGGGGVGTAGAKGGGGSGASSQGGNSGVVGGAGGDGYVVITEFISV